MTLNELALKINDINESKGFNEYPINIDQKLMLIVTELAEAHEELRQDNDFLKIYYEENNKPCGFGVELADTIIRILHLCSLLGIDIDNLVAKKLEYNSNRPYKHGKKF